MGYNDIQGTIQAIQAIGALRDRVNTGVRASITTLTFRLAGKVKEQKLSDQVLHVRTGRLRRSITGRVGDEGGNIVGTVGTNVSYARVHEFGFKGNQAVRAHMRTAKQVFGRQLKRPITYAVAAHSRAVNLPERSFLRSALAEMQPEIQATIAASIKKAADAKP